MTTTAADPATALLRVAEERFSCRAYLPTPVPRSELARMLEIARHSPSWCNTQPWQLDIVSGAATDRLRAAVATGIESPGGPDFAFPPEYTGVHRDRRRACGMQLYESLGIAREDRAGAQRQTMRNFTFFDAPHAAVLTTSTELGTYGAVDCGVYLGHLLLAAQSLGIAAIPQAALALHADLLRRHFGLPEDRWVVCALSIGYPDPDHPANGFRTARAEIAEAVRFHD